MALIFIYDTVCGAYVIALGELLEMPLAVVSVCPWKTAASYSLVWVTDIVGCGFNTVGALPQHLPLSLIAFCQLGGLNIALDIFGVGSSQVIAA